MASGPPGRRTTDVDRLVAEKLRILRQLRALDRAGVDPHEKRALQVPLVRLAEVDAMLTSMIELFDRERAVSGADTADLVGPMLRIAEDVRGEVTDALDARDREALRRASEQVAASAAEVWMEVEHLRKDPGTRGGRRRPMTDREAEAAAKRTWGRKGLSPLPGRRQVQAEERRALPGDDVPLEAWFERLPEPWIQGVARIHDLSGQDRASLPRRLAERLVDGTWLRSFLRDRLGASERERLAWLVEAGSLPFATVRRGLGSKLEVPWDWTAGLPAGSGGKLRAAGFVHVGTRGRAKVVVVPPLVRSALAEALREADPAAATGPQRALRQAAAQASAGQPFADPTLAHWKALDKGLSTVFERWVVKDRTPRAEAALRVLFGTEERVLRSEVERVAIFEYLLFDWRSAPGDATLAEECFRRERFSSPDERALAQATMEAVPGIYRVGDIRRGQDMELIPEYPEGPPVRVLDRAMSLSVEADWLLGGRVYPAGPFFFLRLMGDAVAPDRRDRLVRRLRREQQAFVQAGGADDPGAFLRARPEALLRALRAFRD